MRDAYDIEHTTHVGPARIVSLVPSLTELLFDLGLGANVVGRTRFCIHPEEAAAVPSVGGTKDPDLEHIRRLRPTHLILNIDENPKAVYDALQHEVTCVVTHPNGPHDNLEVYALFAAIFDRARQATELSKRLNETLKRVAVAEQTTPLRCCYLIWKDPWMSVAPDTYIARALAHVGLQTWPTEPDSRYPVVDIEAAVAAVDCVLLSTEPYRFKERHSLELQRQFGLPAARVRLIDGETTSWYGSRAIDGMHQLGEFADQLRRDLAP